MHPNCESPGGENAEFTPTSSDSNSDFFKVRIRFRKDGDLRLVSHHDLMGCFERMFRRAEIPFRSTQGFHPKPRMVFALSLSLGFVGCEEVLELELTESLNPADVQGRLARQCPVGLEVQSVREIGPRQKAAVNRVGYRAEVPQERVHGVAEKVQEFLSVRDHWIERTRPQVRQFNLRPFVDELVMGENGLEMVFWVSQSAGTARPGEVLEVLGLPDPNEAGWIVERTMVEIHDEIAEAENVAQRRPEGLDEIKGQQPTKKTQKKRKSPKPVKPTNSEALLPGPLSFDS
ncbi:MAG: TIGR03936 family radical SAM-associated protein [Gemmataceae bacterium]